MKKMIFVGMAIFFSCSKSGTPGSPYGIIVTGLDHSYVFAIPESDPDSSFSLNLVDTASNQFPGSYFFELNANTDSANFVVFYSPSLHVHDLSFGSASGYTGRVALGVNNQWYFANTFTINSLDVEIKPYPWKNVPYSAAAGGSFEITIQPISTTLDANGFVVPGQVLNRTVHVKGTFNKIYANW